MIYETMIAMQTVSENNSREHWAIKAKRHKTQQCLIKNRFQREWPLITLPCDITLTRMSPRILDNDNLLGALKWVRDEISEYIIPPKTYIDKKGKIRILKGRSDSDSRICWSYAQEKAKIQSVKIRIIWGEDVTFM